MILFNSKKRLITLLIVLVCGIIIFILGLGTTGLVDETPPLFAAAARAMSESGDWITPKVNGMFRFDKPPLIYWLMGFFYHCRKMRSGTVTGQSQQDFLQLWDHYF